MDSCVKNNHLLLSLFSQYEYKMKLSHVETGNDWDMWNSLVATEQWSVVIQRLAKIKKCVTDYVTHFFRTNRPKTS